MSLRLVMIDTNLTLAIQIVDRLLNYCIFTELTERLSLIISKGALEPSKGLDSIRAMRRRSLCRDALRPPADFRWGPPPRHHHFGKTDGRTHSQLSGQLAGAITNCAPATAPHRSLPWYALWSMVSAAKAIPGRRSRGPAPGGPEEPPRWQRYRDA